MNTALLIFLAVLVSIQFRQVSTFIRNTNNDFNYLVPSNYVAAAAKVANKHIVGSKKLVLIGNDLQLQDGNTLAIVIVGETARRANFSLYGYQRETTPHLEEDGVVALKNASSCGTSTKVSLPCIFSPLSRDEFSHSSKNYEFLPSLLARNGVNVLYKDNNFGGCYGTCDHTEFVKTKSLSTKPFCSEGNCVDGILLDGLANYINQHPTNTLVVLHQNGSHGPRYNKRYPKEFEKFTPVCTNSDVAECTKEELINAYDNTILYNDYFLDSVINIAKESKRPTVILYFSDHGESLGENHIFLHGFPYALAPKEQKEIPMIVWMSKSFQESHSINDKCFNKNSYSHDNVFHSILGIFNGKTQWYDKNLDIFNCE